MSGGGRASHPARRIMHHLARLYLIVSLSHSETGSAIAPTTLRRVPPCPVPKDASQSPGYHSHGPCSSRPSRYVLYRKTRPNLRDTIRTVPARAVPLATFCTERRVPISGIPFARSLLEPSLSLRPVPKDASQSPGYHSHGPCSSRPSRYVRTRAPGGAGGGGNVPLSSVRAYFQKTFLYYNEIIILNAKTSARHRAKHVDRRGGASD